MRKLFIGGPKNREDFSESRIERYIYTRGDFFTPRDYRVVCYRTDRLLEIKEPSRERVIYHYWPGLFVVAGYNSCVKGRQWKSGVFCRRFLFRGPFAMLPR